MSIIQAIILAIIEGLTEFLPVSSTGHMIIGSWAMGIVSDPFVKMFTVCIQLGAILSVVVLYFKRFIQSVDFYLKLIVAFIPAVITGVLFKQQIDALLENVMVVAISLIIGGLFLLFIDKWFAANEKKPDSSPTYKQGFIIGVFQCIAMIPGVSRAAASIVGALGQGLNRKSAAEFSFLLAVPTMFGATVKSLWDDKELLMSANVSTLLIGNLVAFIVAMFAIKFFISYLSKYGFRIFGWYRIIVGVIILILLLADIQLGMV